MVDGGGLENHCTRKGTGGSNPSLSANLRSPAASFGWAGALLLMSDICTWLAALEARHLADLTRPELTRALRALSSCYVERREKLTTGAALEGAGKRAAFALFYGPLHFLTTTHVVRALGADAWPVDRILDLGCGTGAAGAAWALAHAGHPAIDGIDRNAWAVQEANRTYRELGVRGTARRGDLTRAFPAARSGRRAILLAYAVNELSAEGRDRLLQSIGSAVESGAHLLVIEPIARRLANGDRRPWFDEWASRLGPLGGRADEWRFPADLPPLLRDLARGAGLDPRELTARTLCTWSTPRTSAAP